MLGTLYLEPTYYMHKYIINRILQIMKPKNNEVRHFTVFCTITILCT